MNEINLKVNVTYGGSSIDDVNNEETNLILFILWGIFLPLIAGMGLVGNILTMVVLWRKEMHSTTILYLRALVVTDTGILIGAVITLTPISCANYLHGDALDYFKDSVYPLIHTPGYYIIMTLQQCNVWITVSVSMERYIAICHPFRAARLITRKKTYVVIVAIVIISCLYNIPHLYATHALPCSFQTQVTSPSPHSANGTAGSDVDVATASTLSTSSMTRMATHSVKGRSSSCYSLTSTEFGTSPAYLTYRTVLYSAIIYVVPFLALVVLNSFLIKELMLMQRRRSGTNINEENEANLSLVLVLIVVVFIFCQTPGLVSQFDVIPIHVFYSWLAVSNLMFTTNSAVNFLIYTAFGRKFRKVLLRVVRHILKGGRKSPNGFRTTHVSNNDYEMSALTNSVDSKQTGCIVKKKHGKDLNSNGRNTESVPLTGESSVFPDVVNDSVGTSNGHMKPSN